MKRWIAIQPTKGSIARATQLIYIYIYIYNILFNTTVNTHFSINLEISKRMKSAFHKCVFEHHYWSESNPMNPLYIYMCCMYVYCRLSAHLPETRPPTREVSLCSTVCRPLLLQPWAAAAWRAAYGSLAKAYAYAFTGYMCISIYIYIYYIQVYIYI